MNLLVHLQAKSRFFCIAGLLALTGCSVPLRQASWKEKLYSIDRGMAADSSIQNFYHPYKLKIDSQMNVVVARTATEIKRGRPEGRLNNLTADALAGTAKKHGIAFDFLHINYKTLRVPLPPGLIKTYKVFELMPFENYLVTVKLSGTDVSELFQYMARLGGDPISGASFKIENGIATEIKVNGETLDFMKTYTVLTNDYLANGGDGASVYLKALERTNHKVKLRDALLEYLMQLNNAGGMVDPKVDGRVLSDKAIADE